MDVFAERCAGLDVHQQQVTVCVLLGEAGKRVRKERRVFATFSRDLLQLGQWLRSLGVTHVAMESTGVYWKPVYAVLEGVEGVQLTVGNAQHIKNVPGRKTDMRDAEWLASLQRHGLIRPSFVPPPEVRRLRDLVRYRTSLVQDRTAQKNRLQKLLEAANVKLASVVSDVFGMTGLAMVRALAAGQTDVDALCQLAQGNLRAKKAQLARALDCRLESHQRWLLGLQLQALDQTNERLAQLETEIERQLAPYQAQLQRLCALPGVKTHAAASLLAEMGPDMSVFKTSAHLAAWAGVCPGNNESAGQHRRQPTRKGNPHLRCTLIEAASAAVRTKHTFWRDKYYRLSARMPKNKAKLAIAHKIAVAAYHLLKDGQPFQDLGPAYLDRLHSQRTTRTLVRRLQALGHHVQLLPAAPPPIPLATAMPS